MRSPVKSLYSVSGSIGADDLKAYVILDKKNNSIHIHFYGKIFGDTQKPILVRHSKTKFPEVEEIDLIKQIVIGEFTNKNIQIKSVKTEKEAPVMKAKPSLRTIIRFKEE